MTTDGTKALARREMVDQLVRQRWALAAIIVASAAVAWWFPLAWALVIVALVLAVRNEWVIHQGRRTLRQ
jgi:hypothetical protein